MKKIYFIMALLVGVNISSLEAITIDWTSGDATDITVLSTELIEALNDRNFSKAKSKVEELLPKMKEHLKAAQKQVKTDEKRLGSKAPKVEVQRLGQVKEIILKQEEIYNSLSYLKKVSPVAYRVKADKVKDLIKDYNTLSEELSAL